MNFDAIPERSRLLREAFAFPGRHQDRSAPSRLSETIEHTRNHFARINCHVKKQYSIGMWADVCSLYLERRRASLAERSCSLQARIHGSVHQVTALEGILDVLLTREDPTIWFSWLAAAARSF